MKTKKMRLSDEADMNKMQEMLTMAEKEKLSVRADKLSWSHHKEVSSIKQLGIVYSDKTVVTPM